MEIAWSQDGIDLPSLCRVDAGLLREAALKLDLVHDVTGTVPGTPTATGEIVEEQLA
jgi:hypothetical protein